MAASLHIGIRNAILALFTGATMAGGNVQKGRAWAMAEQDNQLVKVYLDTSIPERAELQGQPDDWKTRIRCEFHARGSDTVPAEDAADALAVQGYALVMADPSLAGLCMDCYAVGIAWATDEAETSIAVAQIVFEAHHRTSATSISS